MSAGSAFLMLALLSFSGLGICHKVADFRRCRPSAISVMLFFGGAAVLWGYTLLYAVGSMNVSLFPPFTAAAVAVAVLCGAFSGIAILTFQIGIRYGRISTSWLVINLSTIVPAILSLVAYGEWRSGIKWQQLAGLALVLCSVFLLWRDKAVELARTDASQECADTGTRRQGDAGRSGQNDAGSASPHLRVSASPDARVSASSRSQEA